MIHIKMTPDEATVELIDYIYDTHDYKCNEIPNMKRIIKEYLCQGADINKIGKQRNTTPLLMALWVMYDPELVAILAEQGVNKSICILDTDDIYIEELGEEILFNRYLTINNILLQNYHSAILSSKFNNYRKRELCRQRGYIIYPEKMPRSKVQLLEEPYYKKRCKYMIALIHKYCKILDINYYRLITRDEKLPKEL
jgi:hypothetical protein